MMRTSKESVGQLGLVLFVLGLLLSVAVGGFPPRLLRGGLPALFWLLGLVCGIASRTSKIGRIAIWLNAAPFTASILWGLWVAIRMFLAGPIH